MTGQTIISREQALASGLATYFTGKPCKNGHRSERRTATHACLLCTAAASRKHAQNNRERRRAFYAEQRAANREAYRAYWRKWRAANPEKVREIAKRYQTAHPERCAASERNRVARQAAAVGVFTHDDVAKILQRQGYRCAYCRVGLDPKAKRGFHVDHIVALVNGGSNWPSNLQCLCPTCNMAKGSKDPLIFARQLGRLL